MKLRDVRNRKTPPLMIIPMIDMRVPVWSAESATTMVADLKLFLNSSSNSTVTKTFANVQITSAVRS